MPTPLSGARFLQQSASAGVPHIFGFVVPRTVPDDLLWELRNGLTSNERVASVDREGDLEVAGKVTMVSGGSVYAAGGDVELGRRVRVQTGSISPAAGLNHDVDPGEVAYVLVSTNAGGSTITGLSGGDHGRALWLTNSSTTATLTLAHNNAGSSVANRFRFAGGADLIVPPDGSVMLIYNGAASWWAAVFI